VPIQLGESIGFEPSFGLRGGRQAIFRKEVSMADPFTPSRLPENPSLEQYKKQAKDLRKAHGAGDIEIAARIVARLPRASGRTPEAVLAERLSLSDAQLVIARELGFESWPRLKQHIERLRAEQGDMSAALEAFKGAIEDADAGELERLLTRLPKLVGEIGAPLFAFERPAIVAAKDHLELVDVLLKFGADINARSRWERGSYGVLDDTTPEVAEQLILRGAEVDVHAAAGLGKLEALEALLDAEPALVHARGPDGKLPLHAAATPEVVDRLLARGAAIDARDVDHVATAAQYAVRRPAVCRRLIEHGATFDVFIAAALGDVALVERALERAPDTLHAHAPCMLDEKSDYSGYAYPDPPSGSAHIYTWSIGFGWSPAFTAQRLGHAEAAQFLLARCAPAEQLAEACARLDSAAVDALAAQHAGAPRRLQERAADLVVGRSLYLRNFRTPDDVCASIRLFLRAGFDLGAPCYWGATPLHWAAWLGHAQAARLLLEAGAALEARDRVVSGTPLGWALNGCFSPHPDYGQYLELVRLLVDAGAHVEPSQATTDDALINRELARGLART
jgi:ankyrin repeat protein